MTRQLPACVQGADVLDVGPARLLPVLAAILDPRGPPGRAAPAGGDLGPDAVRGAGRRSVVHRDRGVGRRCGPGRREALGVTGVVP